jgi:hypothetical protein
MGNLTREQILARKVGQKVIELPDGSGTVTIRGLHRGEALAIGAMQDLLERDAFLTSAGLVDPAMSVDDVKAWGASDGTDVLEFVSREIGVLSAMVEGAGKSRVSRARR